MRASSLIACGGGVILPEPRLTGGDWTTFPPLCGGCRTHALRATVGLDDRSRAPVAFRPEPRRSPARARAVASRAHHRGTRRTVALGRRVPVSRCPLQRRATYRSGTHASGAPAGRRAGVLRRA